MGRKRRQQQHDSNVLDGSDESTESGDGVSEGLQCEHLSKAINLVQLRKVASKKINNACLDCQKNGTAPTTSDTSNNDDEIIEEPPKMWICLQCGHIACGREQNLHAKEHCETPRTNVHCVVVDTHVWSAWCYKCDNAVNSNKKDRKKLNEVIDILKRGIRGNTPPQLKSQIPLCQNDIMLIDNEKKKMLNDLPKVGGLMNLGNTCFFNAVLQCLAQTPYLIKVLDDLQVPGQKFILPGGKFKGTDDEEVELPPIEGTLDENVFFTPILRKTLTDMQNSNGQTYRPTELYNSLRKNAMPCSDGGQHDSHELLRHLLELVRNEDVKRYQAIILKEAGLSKKTKPNNVDDSLKSRVKYYGNQANAKFLGPERVFRGELVSTLQCLKCHHTSPRTEPFLDLSLPVLIDKSFPSILKRKSTGFDSSIDLISNNISNTPKHEAKKGHKVSHKKNRKLNREHNNLSTSNTNRITEEKKGSVAESEESDADVEDNIENEDISVPEIGESGYSSEKPSALTSPVSLAELHSTNKNVDNVASIVPSSTVSFSVDFNLAGLNENNTDINNSPSPTDVQMTDLSENKKNRTTGLCLPTSSIVHSDFTSPEGPTISPLSSPLTSKDSPTSPISSAVDGDEIEKIDKSTVKPDAEDTQDSSNKEDSLKETTLDLADENSSDNKKNSTTKKLTNGFGEITSNLSKLDLSSPLESPRGYSVKEGECSIQLCLNQFTALELMSENNKVGCEACTKRANKGKLEGVKMVCTDSTKQYLISRVPAVLILHLKRFQVQKFSSRKVGKLVSFPMLLNLAPVCKDYTKPRIYALYGVVEHMGTMYGGHYVAYVKSRAPLTPDDPRWSFLPSKDGFENNDDSKESSESNFELESDEASGADTSNIEAPPGQWYYVSDSRVQKVDEKTVLNSEAYLLFYERIL